MSHAGQSIKKALAVVSMLDMEKPHTSITDWIEVLTSDRYEELSLDGIPELVESVNIQGHGGTGEASRALRKKLKYGNVHRQLRALVILRALTDNAGKGFKLNWADERLMARLKEMSSDNLLDPKVRKRLLLVFHAWSIQYKDEPRMAAVANMYRNCTGGPASRRSSAVPAGGQSVASKTNPTSPVSRNTFTDTNDIFSHDWAPSHRGADTYADLAAAKADAESRKAERERRIALEQREAELERREREQRRKTEMANIEARRQREAAEEQERRRQAKSQMKQGTPQPKKPKFDFQKEKPQVMISVANAIQCANNLVNSCRHVNREHESVQESPKVQENLDKAKAARRTVIRYIQLVQEEEYVGTLLDANEKVVEAIQLYDKLSKPATVDSDSENEEKSEDAKQIDAINKRLQAQAIEADRTGEIQQLQDTQKRESARRQQRRQMQRQASSGQDAGRGGGGRGGSGHPDLQDLDFGSIPSGRNQTLPPPMRPDEDRDSYAAGNRALSDYSDDYDSSDDEWQRARSRRQSLAGQKPKPAPQAREREWATLDDDQSSIHRGGLLDPNDPFGDPFAADDDTPMHERQRMQWREV